MGIGEDILEKWKYWYWRHYVSAITDLDLEFEYEIGLVNSFINTDMWNCLINLAKI